LSFGNGTLIPEFKGVPYKKTENDSTGTGGWNIVVEYRTYSAKPLYSTGGFISSVRAFSYRRPIGMPIGMTKIVMPILRAFDRAFSEKSCRLC
jgi:hypothetical protein